MNRNRNDINTYNAPAWLWILSAAAVVAGVIGLLIGLIFGKALHAWLWMVVGFVYFGGIANGMLAWAAIFRVAQARWSAVINRLGHSVIWFTGFQLLALVVLLIGVRSWIPWVHGVSPAKQAWLNVPFMVIRDIVLMLALAVLYFLLVRWSLAANAKAARGQRITEHDQYKLTAVGLVAIFIYCITMTIISYDFIMSLTPEWISTMFGPYYFCTNLYVGMAVLILLAALLRRRPGIEHYLGANQFHDMGNLFLGFSLFCMGLFFAQYLTIWYANIPYETEFLIVRYLRGSWPVLGWASFIVGYAIPFLLLQSRGLKRNPRLLMPVTLLAIAGVGLERYVLVVPSLLPDLLLMSVISGLGLLAFAGAFVLAIIVFLRKYPPVSVAQAVLAEAEAVEVTA